MGNTACCGEEKNTAPAELVEAVAFAAGAPAPKEESAAGVEPDTPVPLMVVIVGACGLKSEDSLCEAYCTCQIRGRGGSVVQTEGRSLRADPEWNQEFELADYEKGDSLEFAVFSAKPGSTDETLGKALLSLEEIRPGYAGHLALLESKLGAYLSVKAAVGGDYPEMPETMGEGALADNTDEYKISVAKTTRDSKIGVDIVPQGESALRVKRIKEGLIMKWNGEHEQDVQVEPGDWIVAVNGFRGAADGLLARISRDTTLEIVLRRVPG
uniref:C2 domain-containing protein n=1 Tax=Alexandrium catenella TaxID=2925 RepID=A0A7S1PPI9_ALECA